MMMKNKRGGALLLTLILVGIITSSAVAGSRIMISRQRVTGALEDSSIAYNSAESGIEYALSLFRYDRDIDLPRCKDDSLPFNDCQENGTDYPMENDNPKYVLRVDVTKMGTSNQNDDDAVQIVREGTRIPKCSEEPGDICHQYFDLRVWYRTNEVKDMELERDEGVEFSLPEGNNVSIIKLDFDKIGEAVIRNPGSSFHYGINAEMLGGVQNYDAELCTEEKIRPKICIINFNEQDIKKFRLNALGAKMDYDLVAEPWDDTQPVYFGGPTTYIESTGYYGDAARKLRVEVDRNSGTILQLFDNVLYSGEGGLR